MGESKLRAVSIDANPDLLRGRSEALRTFVAEAPLERTSIVAFVADNARRLPLGARVLDVGAGDAPYRELFAAQEYVTLDHDQSPHAGDIDIIASADSIPVGDGSFDAVVCTQVLEHVRDPAVTLTEIRRVLAPVGALVATVPFAWEEHELPHDYYRYTKPGIEHLLDRAGFVEPDVRPRTDCFTTIAQLLRNARWAMGAAPDGLDAQRVEARAVLEAVSDALVQLAPLDVKMLLPLGYTVFARAGADASAP